MHTITVYGTDPKDATIGRDYHWPGSWQECTIQQLGTIAALTTVTIAAEADEHTRERAEAHLRLCLLRELSAMPERVFERIDVSGLMGLLYDEHGAAAAALLPGLDWCLEEPRFAESIVPEVVVAIGKKRVTYAGPTNRLSRFTLKQWGFAEALLANLAETGTVEAMDNLLGALYAPAGERWDNALLEHHASVLHRLDDRTKLAAVLNYRGLRSWLATAYPQCFRGGKADRHGMQGMVVRLAGGKHGTVQETYDANLHDVLVDLEQKMSEQPTPPPPQP